MSARRSSLTSTALIAIVTLIASCRTTTAQANPETVPLHRGEALFLGNAPLQGKPRDHRDFLPPLVVRCANCHTTGESSGKLHLDAAMLTELRQRRHGPPSAYDQTKFCKLLRTGIDPAYVMVDHIMPIYDLPDTDCAALWSYLLHSEQPHADK